MIITDYLRSDPDLQWAYARQMGVEHAVIRLPEDKDFDCTNEAHWQEIYRRYVDHGLTPLVLEPMPNHLHEHIKTGDEHRDACIHQVIRMFPIMDRLGIRTICLNFMAHIGWYRSSKQLQERGGALVTGFRLKDVPAETAQVISEETLWGNLYYFLKAVIPAAEQFNIRLAFHPDDPPVSPLGRVSRILTSFQSMHKAVHLVESPQLGVTLCQGTFRAMGEDLEQVISAFAAERKLFFVHFRDIAGDKTDFRETFHDNGPTDMARMIRLYRELGCSVPVRVDHVPTMAGEDNANPGYAALGRLFAIGYLKGLLDGVEA